MGQGNCPSEQELAAFNFGDLPEASLEAISQHLESCPGCEAFLDSLDGRTDSAIASLRNLGSARVLGRIGALTASRAASELPDVPGYEVLAVLGEGGMSVVYLARQVGLDRLVALKLLRGGSTKRLARFRAEALADARMQHPHIVQIFEIGEHQGQPYLALELLQGGSLEAKLAGQPQAPCDAAALVGVLARAIQYAHGRGIVHRDLKPSNVLLTADGTAKIADFGLAKFLLATDGHTQEGDLVGTPRYMAPEQTSGALEAVGPTADVYSLGVILYELLTGRAPLRAPTTVETLILIRSQEPLPPSRLLPRLPRDLETICLKCLQKDPHRRYASAQELADDLERFLAGKPVRARPVRMPEKVLKWVRRRPAQAAACGLAALVLVLAGLGGGAAALWQRTEGALEREQRAKEDVERARAAEQKAKDDLDVALDQHRVLFAHAAWRDYAMGRAERLLLECAPERRDWEWRYVYRLCHTDLLTLRGHSGDVTSVSYSPDGRHLLTVSWDGTAKVWDPDTGKEVLIFKTLRGTEEPMTAGAFSSDGRRLATGTQGGMVKVWDAATGKELLAPKGHRQWVTAVAFSRDGRRLSTGCIDGMAKIWDAATGEEIRSLWGQAGEIRDMAFSPDGTRLATAHAWGSVCVWDAATGKQVQSLRGHAREVLGVAFSPDGSRLATAAQDGTAKVWDAASGKEIRALAGHASKMFSVAFSPDGRRLATAHENGTARVWDAATGQETLSIRGHPRAVRSVAFSPDGRRLATASNDGTAKVWDTAVNQECLTWKGHSDRVLGVAFSSDGRRLATASNDQTAKVWDAASGKEIRALRGHTRNLFSVAFSPDGSRLATASEDGTAKLWEAVTGKEMLTLTGPTGPVRCAAFSSDGSRVATAHEDGTAKVWEAATGKEALTLRRHASVVHSVAFSPDGSRLATASWDSTVKVWDAATGQAALTIEGPKEDRLHGSTFSPDGRRLAVACLNEATARVWDAATGQEVLTLKGHTFQVAAVAFSPDGKRLATASYDGTAKLWDADTGQETLTLKGHSVGLTSVVFSADGQRLATADLDGTVKIWDARPVPPPEAPPGERR
jgi:WD40 repeat protein